MHSGVRTAGPVDRLTDPAIEASQRGFEFPLDRPDPGPLSLEAGEVRAIVFNPCPEPTCRPSPGDTLSSASSVVQLDELDLDDRGGIAPTRADLHDPGVAGRPVGIFGSDLVEKLRDDERLVRKRCHDGPPGGEVALLGEGDHPLDATPDLLGLRP